MFDFNYYTPTNIIFGEAKEKQVGNLIEQSGCKKVLLHYGSGSVKKSGLLERVKKSLEEKEISYVELGGVVPNPRLSLVYEGIELAKKEKVDFILAIGGGSVIDSAKAIGFGAVNEGDVWDFFERKRNPKACIPIGCIITIAAAGSEMSKSSVITKEEGNIKIGYPNAMARPIFAILNPELTMTLSAYQTGSGCTDILMHTAERYFTSGGNMELTDSIAEALMRTVIKYAKILHEDPQNYDARAEMMWAGSLSHNGLTGCGTDGGDWATHLLEQEVSGLFDVIHGAGMAVLWGSWARCVYKNCIHRFYKFAVCVMGIEESKDQEAVALKGIEALEAFFDTIDMPTSFQTLGVVPTDEEIELMVEKCWSAKGGNVGSAMKLTKEDMIHIFKSARD